MATVAMSSNSRELANISNMISIDNEADAGDMRRERFKHRRTGSGRETTRREFNLNVGRRTGVPVKTNVKRNSDGFEDVNAFWRSGSSDDDDDDEEDADEDRTTQQERDSVASKVQSVTPKTSRPSLSSKITPISSEKSARTTNTATVSTISTPVSSVSSTPGTTFSANADEEDDVPPMHQDQEDASFDETVLQDDVDMNGFDPEDDESERSESDRESVTVATKVPPKKRRRGRPRGSKTKNRRGRPKKEESKRKRKYEIMRTPVQDAVYASSPNVTVEKPSKIILPEPNPNGLRRSKRTRFKPLKYWKNERIEFAADPETKELVVLGANREGVPTPLLRRSKQLTPGPKTPAYLKKKKKRTTKVSKKRAVKQEAPVVLPEDFEENVDSQAIFRVRKDGAMHKEKKDAIRRKGSNTFRALPCEGEIAPKACGTFDDDAFVSGVVRLDPGSEKDLESVRGCTQVFYVIEAQEGSVEFQIGKKKGDNLPYLLSAGDHFVVWPHNSYSFKNHSTSTCAELHFVVIKPTN